MLVVALDLRHARLEVRGELDVHTSELVPWDASWRTAQRTVTFDLTGVRFIDCAGFRTMVAGVRRAGDVTVVPGDAVRRLAMLLGFGCVPGCEA